MARKPAALTVNRYAILNAAATVFQERGYHGTTMQQIAERVNLTAGSLYHHFPAGKRDLLLAVLNTGLETVLAQVDTIIAQQLEPRATLHAMIRAHVVNVTQNMAVGAAMVFEIRALRDFEDENAAVERDAFFKRRAAFEGRFRTVIQHGMDTGVFRIVDTGVFTKALLGAHNWVTVWYRPGGRLDGEQIAAQIADVFLTSLEAEQLVKP